LKQLYKLTKLIMKKLWNNKMITWKEEQVKNKFKEAKKHTFYFPRYWTTILATNQTEALAILKKWLNTK